MMPRATFAKPYFIQGLLHMSMQLVFDDHHETGPNETPNSFGASVDIDNQKRLKLICIFLKLGMYCIGDMLLNAARIDLGYWYAAECCQSKG